jgi:hypothetical protein
MVLTMDSRQGLEDSLTTLWRVGHYAKFTWSIHQQKIFFQEEKIVKLGPLLPENKDITVSLDQLDHSRSMFLLLLTAHLIRCPFLSGSDPNIYCGFIDILIHFWSIHCQGNPLFKGIIHLSL